MSVKELISKFEMINTKSAKNFNNFNNIKSSKQYKLPVNGRAERLISFWENQILKINNIVKCDISTQNEKSYNRLFKKTEINFINEKNIDGKDKIIVNVGNIGMKGTKKEVTTVIDNKNKSKEIVNKRERLRSRMATVINWPSKS